MASADDMIGIIVAHAQTCIEQNARTAIQYELSKPRKVKVPIPRAIRTRPPGQTCPDPSCR